MIGKETHSTPTVKLKIRAALTDAGSRTRPDENVWAEVKAIIQTEIGLLYRKTLETPAPGQNVAATRLNPSEVEMLRKYIEMMQMTAPIYARPEDDPGDLSDEEIKKRLGGEDG